MDSLRLEETEYHRRILEVYSAHPNLRPSNDPMLGMFCGAIHSGVWFLAENPSATQLSRGPADRDRAFNVSTADKLLQSMLVKHGFRDAPERGGTYRCYLTNVIKVAYLAEDWKKLPNRDRLALAEACSDVLAWEMQMGYPKIIVTMGKKVKAYIDHLAARHFLPTLPETMFVEHYSYVAFRPRGKMGPMHPERLKEYDAQFAAVAYRWRKVGSAV